MMLRLTVKEVGVEVAYERADADIEADVEFCIRIFLGPSWRGA